jgi:hypothetical protein
VNSTMLTAPSSTEVPMTPLAVILKPSVEPPAWPVTSDSALLMLSKTFIASSARYSTEVATIATTNSTSDTAKANFITDHGSIRFRCSRARRGPRVAAPATVARAERTASVTRAAPTAGPVVRPGGVTTGDAPVAVRSAVEPVTGARAMTCAEPVALAAPLAPVVDFDGVDLVGTEARADVVEEADPLGVDPVEAGPARPTVAAPVLDLNEEPEESDEDGDDELEAGTPITGTVSELVAGDTRTVGSTLASSTFAAEDGLNVDGLLGAGVTVGVDVDVGVGVGV